MHWQLGLAIAWVLLPVCVLAAGQDTLVTTRFATACADCHEGQCSGRMSFALRPEAAFNHIRQYAGPVDDDLAMELHAALERMKSECRYAMPRVIDLAQGWLEGRKLAETRDAWSGSYFIALPDLAAGVYRIAGEMPGGGRIRIELVDAQFEPWVDECTDVRDGLFDLDFSVPRTHGAFLRLRPSGHHAITRLSFGTVD
jgi:hypothetical protein